MEYEPKEYLACRMQVGAVPFMRVSRESKHQCRDKYWVMTLAATTRLNKHLIISLN
jgi:hypothetical protein